MKINKKTISYFLVLCGILLTLTGTILILFQSQLGLLSIFVGLAMIVISRFFQRKNK